MGQSGEGNGHAKSYTVADLKTHTSEQSCYLLVHGKVHDVTEFLDEHPGGYDIILNTTGRDATEDFEEIGHSNAAREMLDKYVIGDFEGGSAQSNIVQEKVDTSSANQTADTEPSALVTTLKALLPLVIILIAAYFALGKK